MFNRKILSTVALVIASATSSSAESVMEMMMPMDGMEGSRAYASVGISNFQRAERGETGVTNSHDNATLLLGYDMNNHLAIEGEASMTLGTSHWQQPIDVTAPGIQSADLFGSAHAKHAAVFLKAGTDKRRDFSAFARLGIANISHDAQIRSVVAYENDAPDLVSRVNLYNTGTEISYGLGVKYKKMRLDYTTTNLGSGKYGIFTFYPWTFSF